MNINIVIIIVIIITAIIAISSLLSLFFTHRHRHPCKYDCDHCCYIAYHRIINRHLTFSLRTHSVIVITNESFVRRDYFQRIMGFKRNWKFIGNRLRNLIAPIFVSFLFPLLSFIFHLPFSSYYYPCNKDRLSFNNCTMYWNSIGIYIFIIYRLFTNFDKKFSLERSNTKFFENIYKFLKSSKIKC